MTHMRKPIRFDNCVDCEQAIAIYHALQKRCKTCQRRYKNTKPKTYNKVCDRCSKDFRPRNNRSVSCPDCQKVFPCGMCGQPTERTSPSRKYCSTNCQNTAKAEKYFDGNYRARIERDGNKCVRCDSKNKLHVHHIDYSGYGLKSGEANNDISNLITLCDRCHSQLHATTNRILVQHHLDEARQILKDFVENLNG